jgi:hypothetical protein
MRPAGCILYIHQGLWLFKIFCQSAQVTVTVAITVLEGVGGDFVKKQHFFIQKMDWATSPFFLLVILG